MSICFPGRGFFVTSNRGASAHISYSEVLRQAHQKGRGLRCSQRRRVVVQGKCQGLVFSDFVSQIASPHLVLRIRDPYLLRLEMCYIEGVGGEGTWGVLPAVPFSFPSS